MRNYLCISMLCLALGGHVSAYAHTSEQAKRKPRNARVCGNLCVNGKTTLHDTKIHGKLFVDGKPIDKQWVIPLTDNLDSPPPGSALVYLSVEEVYNPVEIFGQIDPVSLVDFSDTTVTVTQVGDLVSFVVGSGDPFNNLVWSQENDYSKMPNNAPLVIDFTGTAVEHLIVNGANHTILTAPGAYNSSGGQYTSKTGIAQIGPGGKPIVKFFVENDSSVSGVVTLDANGSFLVTDAILLTLFPEDNIISLTVMPGQAPDGTVYISNIDNSGFVIQSTAGSDDAGVNVAFTIVPNYNSWALKGWPAGNNAIPDFHLIYTLQDE